MCRHSGDEGKLIRLDARQRLELTALASLMLVLGRGLYLWLWNWRQLFARAGVDVTLGSAAVGVASPKRSPEVSAALEGYLADEGIRLGRGKKLDRISSKTPPSRCIWSE